MRGLQEAVVVSPPFSSTSSKIGAANSLPLTTTSSAVKSLPPPTQLGGGGWWTFVVDKDSHICFDNEIYVLNVQPATQNDFVLLASQPKDFYIDDEIYFRAIADTLSTSATLRWYRSSR